VFHQVLGARSESNGHWSRGGDYCPPASCVAHVPALQVRPLWHRLAPKQHGWPAAPQATQLPGVPLAEFRPLHANPEPVQVPNEPPPQQGCPSAPQVPHWLVTDAPSKHPSEPVQAVGPPSVGNRGVEQQVCPAPPQVSHIPPDVCPALRPEQPRPELQVPPRPQQGSMEAPQDSQVPAAPASVCPTQVSLELWQVPPFPAQHAWPEAPQFLQVPPPLKPNPVAFGLSQPNPELHCVAPRQQGSFSPPQAPQTTPPSPLTQPSDPWQVKPPQQACPAAPQAEHIPLEQFAPAAVQNGNEAPASLPPQQVWPTAPQGVPDAVEQLPLPQVPERPVPVHASPEPMQVC